MLPGTQPWRSEGQDTGLNRHGQSFPTHTSLPWSRVPLARGSTEQNCGGLRSCGAPAGRTGGLGATHTCPCPPNPKAGLSQERRAATRLGEMAEYAHVGAELCWHLHHPWPYFRPHLAPRTPNGPRVLLTGAGAPQYEGWRWRQSWCWRARLSWLTIRSPAALGVPCGGQSPPPGESVPALGLVLTTHRRVWPWGFPYPAAGQQSQGLLVVPNGFLGVPQVEAGGSQPLACLPLPLHVPCKATTPFRHLAGSCGDPSRADRAVVTGISVPLPESLKACRAWR